MSREYRLKQLLTFADNFLRRYSYDFIDYAEIDADTVIVRAFNQNYGEVTYLGNIWDGTFTPIHSLNWVNIEEVIGNQNSDSGY